MNRKQWIIAGIVVAVLLVFGVILIWKNRSDDSAVAIQAASVSNLAYCAGEQARPCIVSFSTDADDNMLVNILLPETAFPNFYLKIIRVEGESIYACQRVSQAVNNTYCTGEKLPPGELLHLQLISTKNDILLAEGDLSIIGLAYPTVGVVTPTLEEMPDEPTAVSDPTERAIPAPTQTRTSTPTPLSYPNPSYPNPSYPNPSYP